MNSAIRRHHYRRLQKTRQWFWFGPLIPREAFCDLYIEREAQRLGTLTRTPHPCSCMGCGNKRQACGLPRNERRAPRVTDWEDGQEPPVGCSPKSNIPEMILIIPPEVLEALRKGWEE